MAAATAIGLLAAACSSGGHGRAGAGRGRRPTPAATLPATTAPGPSPSTNGSGGGAGALTPPGPGPTGLRWYIGVPVLNQLVRADPTLAQNVFDNPGTFVAITSSSEVGDVPPGWDVTVVETFFDGSQLVQAVGSGQIPSQVKAVVLDDEQGNHGLTPAAEQADPIPLEQEASAAARAKGLLFIDVGNDAQNAGSAGRYHAAEYASVVDLQIQLSETDIARYDSAVQQGVAAFKQLNPSVVVLAGITATINDQPAPVTDMLQAVQTTRSEVAGYWLNCTPCQAPEVNAAVQFLQQLTS
jgi:hypothetical protein